MFRNDTLVPFLALVMSVALAFVAWAERRGAAEVAGHMPGNLTSVQIALLAFSALLVVYGTVGLLSVWLDGNTLRPGIRGVSPRLASLVVGIVASLAIAVLGALLIGAILSDLRGMHVAPVVEGGLLGAIFLLCAVVLAVYRKYFVKQEALVEDEDSEVPW
jgi:hypothetical protein